MRPVLLNRHVLAAWLKCSVKTVYRHGQPVACDRATRAVLYDAMVEQERLSRRRRVTPT
jgi:hypothetical protein